jgi:hypothetical protein
MFGCIVAAKSISTAYRHAEEIEEAIGSGVTWRPRAFDLSAPAFFSFLSFKFSFFSSFLLLDARINGTSQRHALSLILRHEDISRKTFEFLLFYF